MVCFLLPQDKGGAFYSLVGGEGVPSIVGVCGTLNLDHVLGAQNHTHLNQHLQVVKLDDTYLYCTMMFHISTSQKISKLDIDTVKVHIRPWLHGFMQIIKKIHFYMLTGLAVDN